MDGDISNSKKNITTIRTVAVALFFFTFTPLLSKRSSLKSNVTKVFVSSIALLRLFPTQNAKFSARQTAGAIEINIG